MTDLKELLGLARVHAHRVLITDAQPELVPMYHLVVPPPGQDVIVMTPWPNNQEKAIVFAAVKRKASEIGAVAAMFVGETWIRPVPKPLTSWHAAHQDLTTPPSEHPDRKECVFAIATDGDKTESCMWQIVRARPSGPIIALVEEKEMSGSFEGRLIEGLIQKHN